MLFYASPILYVATKCPDNVERILMSNPIAVVLTQMRHAVPGPDARRPRRRRSAAPCGC